MVERYACVMPRLDPIELIYSQEQRGREDAHKIVWDAKAMREERSNTPEEVVFCKLHDLPAKTSPAEILPHNNCTRIESARRREQEHSQEHES